ncbi:TetR/AcrR family transcriptional regulator [Xanthomonas sp. WHRI 7945]|nr:TetR/AcrR family transcriptional regulator [Xanthomonas campestris pv. campestris]
MPRHRAAPVPRRRAPAATREKRAAILRAARQLFSRDGFDHTNMDAIAACADVSKATIYAHFANKDALFRATVDAMVGEMPDRWEALLATAGPLQPRLAAVAHALMEMATGPLPKAIHRMLALSTQFALPHADTHWDLCFERYDRAMQRFLRAETGRGTLAIADVAHASAQFFGLVAGAPALRVLLTGAAVAPERSAAACVDSAVALFVQGYRPDAMSAAASPVPAPPRRAARRTAGAARGSAD